MTSAKRHWSSDEYPQFIMLLTTQVMCLTQSSDNNSHPTKPDIPCPLCNKYHFCVQERLPLDLWCKFIAKPRKSFSTFIVSNRVGCPYYITAATFIMFLSNFWYQINVFVAGVWMRNGGVWRFCPCCYPLGVEGGVRRATQQLHPFE